MTGRSPTVPVVGESSLSPIERCSNAHSVCVAVSAYLYLCVYKFICGRKQNILPNLGIFTVEFY